MNAKKGFTLAVVLGVCFIFAAMAVLMVTKSRDDMAIAGNNRRALQAKLAAVSGISHFKSMDVFYEQLRQRANNEEREEFTIIGETPLGDKTYYKVEAQLCCNLGENEFIIKSTGYYKDTGNVIAKHVKHSLFKTVD